MTPLVAIAPASTTVEDGDLTYRRCHWCHSAAAVTCMLCPVCGSADLMPARGAGQGTVQRMLRPARRGSHPDRPYLVTLDEGFSVQATVVGGLPGAVPIGTRVQLTSSEDDGRHLTFRPLPRVY